MIWHIPPSLISEYKRKKKASRKSDLLIENHLWLVREYQYIIYLWWNVHLIWQTISLETLAYCSFYIFVWKAVGLYIKTYIKTVHL